MTSFIEFLKNISARALGRVSRQRAIQRPDADAGLLAFRSEAEDSVPATTKPRRPGGHQRTVIVSAAAVLAFVCGAVVYVAANRLQAARPSAPAAVESGTAVFESHPPANVTIDGVVRGATPLSLRLPAGAHTAVMTAGQATRSFSLNVEAGSTIRQDVEFAAAAAPATAGRLDVTSEPSGARVSVDGTGRGTTPLSIAEIAVGPHQLTISNGDTTVRRSITIRPGATSSVDASLAASGSSAGWLSLTSPVELTVTEDDQIVGTTKAARVMLPAGSHNLVLTNAALEFQTTMMVRIDDGKTLKRAVALPNGSLSVNAAPWANVLVDGGEVGMTPLANVALPIGTHEVIWRHPQLGERRRTVAISAKTPTRIGMDFK